MGGVRGGRGLLSIATETDGWGAGGGDYRPYQQKLMGGVRGEGIIVHTNRN